MFKCSQSVSLIILRVTLSTAHVTKGYPSTRQIIFVVYYSKCSTKHIHQSFFNAFFFLQVLWLRRGNHDASPPTSLSSNKTTFISLLMAYQTVLPTDYVYLSLAYRIHSKSCQNHSKPKTCSGIYHSMRLSWQTYYVIAIITINMDKRILTCCNVTNNLLHITPYNKNSTFFKENTSRIKFHYSILFNILSQYDQQR